MSRYAQHVSTRQTPQSEPILGKNQVKNSAGGFGFQVDQWTRLDRFLILGNEGGTYYASEKKLTMENAQCILGCIKADGPRTVNRIVEISDSGRAPKNDPAIFALAMCISHGDAPTKEFAARSLSKVCRIGTHLFQFVEAALTQRGWGRLFRDAVAQWYIQNPSLDYQLVKYQSRNGWSNRDLIRLTHAKPKDDVQSMQFAWALGKENAQKAVSPFIEGFELAKAATTATEIASIIRKYNLPRECIPTQFLTEVAVWEALLEKMPMTAIIRNLGNMAKLGLVAPMSNAAGKIIAELANVERLRKSRVHPIQILGALLVYKQGRGEKGSNVWNAVPQVIDALDGAFYNAFANVEPTSKRWLLGLDVSGSMDCGTVGGFPGLTPRIGVGAMALVTAAVEKNHAMVAFTSGSAGEYTYGSGKSMHYGYRSGLTPLSISPRQRLDDVCHTMKKLPMGGTDCSLPMLYALEQKIPVDVFVVMTDSETWAGEIHPIQAIDMYRQKMGIPAKMIVVGMTATDISIADADDGGMLDVVGFDTNAPAIMSDFVRS